MTNRLASEQSPYLLQHADNPVDWFAFGEEAFERARSLDRPLFISIGYSACHWCHVMAHESFEDVHVAKVLNEHFVSVKVDREERPDVDALYVEAAQALTGSAGWPLSVFCHPDGRPFYVGTYFPPRRTGSMPSFVEVLEAISSAFEERRDDLEHQAQQLTDVVERRLRPPPRPGSATPPGEELLDLAVDRFFELYDSIYGGIGTAPKFAQPPMLELMAFAYSRGRSDALGPVRHSLEQMARGGIYDQLGGGFSRYSVDRHWLVPHFEKMLYDQALLTRAYLHAYLLSGEEGLLRVAEETVAYVLRDLYDGGGLYSAEDADSQGEEGRFYTWSVDELVEVLGEHAGRAAGYFGVGTPANFEHGRSVLSVCGKAYEALSKDKAALFAARARRVRPGRDEKVLTEWNAMMGSVLAEGALALRRSDWGDAAVAIGEFLLGHLKADDGRWRRSYRHDLSRHLATLADHGWLCELFSRLYELTGRARYLDEARAVAEEIIEAFSSPDGGFYLNRSEVEALAVRPRDLYDGVTPAASSIAISSLFRLAALTTERRYAERATIALELAAGVLCEAPLALSHLVVTKCLVEEGFYEIVVVGEHPEVLSALAGRYLPGAVVAWGEPGATPLFDERMDDNCYVCRNGTCSLPVVGEAALSGLLDELSVR